MIRTGYSFRVAVGHLPDVVSRVREIGWRELPVADRVSTFAFVNATREAKKAGLRVVYGVEIAVVPALGEKRPIVDYWRFYARKSLRPLNDLVGTATSNPGREPSLLYKQALSAPGLVKVSGERLLLDEVKRILLDGLLDRDVGRDFYVGLSPATPRLLFREASERGFRFAAVPDNLYPRREDAEFYKVAIGSRSTTQTYPQWIVSDDEWRDSVGSFAGKKEQDAAIRNRAAILHSCRAELRRAELLVPEKKKTLRAMCVDGARKNDVDLRNPTYALRLDRELGMIAEKKFEDYFYILADMIAWAKRRMVVGPARGSSCGSLVCYLLGITAVDPIPHGLVFERFIDVTRADLPDVDVDFSDARRHMVFEYAEKKYGREHVARLGSVGTFQPRSALNQVAISLRIPSWRMDKVTAGIIQRAQGDNRASQTIEDTLTTTDVGRALVAEYPEVAIVARLEDHPHAAGQHAAGVVITKLPIAEHAAVDRRTGAVMADKKDAEALDLLKIDALGLTQLSVFERTLELTGRPSVSGFLETIPLDDPAAFDVLNRGHFSGVFQFMGQSVQGLTKRIRINKLEDLVAITALARPGPLGGGGAETWSRRRIGSEPVSYPHPAFEPYLRDSLGIVIYQEQVLAIGREIGDLSWEEVTKLRQAMSKSLGKEYFDQFGDKWKANAVKKGIPAALLERIWEDLCNFGAWAFNRSHSVAYGIVSYWCCWLKAHHPVEFAAATLDAESDPAKQIAMLRELRDEGVDYVAVDPDLSTERWTPARRGKRTILVGPLTAIRGIGPATVAEILEARSKGTELRPSVAKRLAAAKTDIDSLYPVRDAVARIAPKNIVSTPVAIRDIGATTRGEVMIIAVADKIQMLNENELVRIQKRNGRRVFGPENSLNLFVSDDTGRFFCKVHRRDYERIGKEIVERGKPGKAIYALKGEVFSDAEFSMLWVRRARYLGDLQP